MQCQKLNEKFDWQWFLMFCSDLCSENLYFVINFYSFTLIAFIHAAYKKWSILVAYVTLYVVVVLMDTCRQEYIILGFSIMYSCVAFFHGSCTHMFWVYGHERIVWCVWPRGPEEEEGSDQNLSERNRSHGGKEKEKEINHLTGLVTQYDKTTSSGMIDNTVYFDLSVVIGGIKPQVK